MAEKTLRINADAQERFRRFILGAYEIRDEGFNLRNRLEIVDRAHQMEYDKTEEQRKARLANRKGNAAKLQNMQTPMLMEAVETTKSFLTNVYLLDYPMFKFGADPEKQDLASMWNALVGEDQIHYGWAGQFSMAFANGSKYNIAPIEVDWKKTILYKPANGTGPNGVDLQQVVREGNCIISHDPYNIIYDTRVPLYKCHEEGEFGGYVRRMSRIQLKKFLADLGEDRLPNDKKAFEAGDWEIQYYVPSINPDTIADKTHNADGSFNWVSWVTNDAQHHIQYKNMYTVVVLYARIMPYEFGIWTPMDQTPDIWKLVCVNGVMVYARPIPNSHDYLPMIFVQPIVDNLDHQTKSQAENQLPFQEMTSALWNAKLASARRRTTDRMLYNPILVDPDHINSPNPSAKIPIRPTAYGRKLEEAVYVFPFEDGNSQYFLQEAQAVAEWGLRAQGINRPMVGQFQKGNKLQQEWNDTMANAGAPQRSQAIMWEVFGMQPIKTILKDNYLQFAPGGKKYNRATQTYVNVDMQQLRQSAAEFEVGDGLLPIQKLTHTDILQSALQYLQGDPGVAAEYNKGDLFAYLMKIQGVDKLDKFKKSPEQLQYEQALAAWSQAAQAIAPELIKQNKSPEEVTKYIGPMPQPPQQPMPQQPGVQNAIPTA